MNKHFSDKITDEILSDIKSKIMSADKILLMPHQRADWDGLGSSLAMQIALAQLGKDSDVALSDHFIPETIDWLPGAQNVLKEFDVKDYDLVILIDHSELWRTGFTDIYPGIEKLINNIIIIDHHAVCKLPEKVLDMTVLIDSDAPATAMLMYEILVFLSVDINVEIATCLLSGIYTDTGSFQHSNATPDAHRIAGELISLGADLAAIRSKIFQHSNSAKLKLWGRVLDRAKLARSGFTVSAITELDFLETGTTKDDLAGVDSLLRGVPNSKGMILLYEKDNMIKGSFRTERDDVDVAAIAKIFSGGGHRKAAGFVIPGKLSKETSWKID